MSSPRRASSTVGKSAASADADLRRDGDSVDRAVEALRLLIVTGEIQPGTQLSQVELARRVGVSTTPVREALRQLEAEGLVESRRNLRPRVPVFDPTDLDTVYSNRILLEALGISLTVPLLTDDDRANLRSDLDRMRAAAKRRDLKAWEVVHAEFHIRLIGGCERPLRRQIRVMMARSDRYRRMSVLGEQPHSWTLGGKEHEAIVAACEAGDAGEARRRLARHLSRSAFSVLAHLAPESEPTAVKSALEIVLADSGDTEED